MNSPIDNPVSEEAIILVVEEPAETNMGTIIFITVYLFQILGHIFNVAAIYRVLIVPLGRIWTNYYPREALGEEAIVFPPSSFTFIITALLAFIEIKSQGNVEFPFQTHPNAIMVSVTSLLMYGFASAAEFAISAAGFDPNSDYATIARLVRIVSLCILVGSLASLLYC